MSDSERIELLEKEIAELKEILSTKKLVSNWAPLRDKITKQLFVAFSTERMSPHIAQCQSAISCLVGKSFCKNNVTALTKAEAEEADVFISYILDFMVKTRSRNRLEDPIRGYERETD